GPLGVSGWASSRPAERPSGSGLAITTTARRGTRSLASGAVQVLTARRRPEPSGSESCRASLEATATQTDTSNVNHYETLGQDARSEAIEIGKYKDVTVQIVRTGSTITATVQVSNDKTNWVTAHSRRQSIAAVEEGDGGGGGHVALAAITGGVETLLERARWLRVVTSNDDETIDFIVSAPSARG